MQRTVAQVLGWGFVALQVLILVLIGVTSSSSPPISSVAGIGLGVWTDLEMLLLAIGEMAGLGLFGLAAMACSLLEWGAQAHPPVYARAGAVLMLGAAVIYLSSCSIGGI